MNRLYNIFFILSAIFTYGQVTLVAGPEEKEFKVNQRFTVTFVLEIRGENMYQETPLRMPDFSKFEVLGNASDQNTIVLEKGIVNQQVVQWVLEPKQAGRVKIGSALVTVNGKIYKTEPFEIFVKEADKKSVAVDNSMKDVYLNMEVENKEVYENQPTIAVLRAYSKDYNNFRKVKNIKLPRQQNLNIRPVSYQKSEIEPNGEMASQVLAVFMIFPNESGKVEVAPVSANLLNKESKIVSNKVKLNVKKLPENSPVDYKNAVGEFNLNIANNTKHDHEVEKPIDVFVKLSGEGNFANIDLPKIRHSEDYSVFQPRILKKTSPGNSAMMGEIIAHYVVVPKKSGPLTIATENFSYFNPQSQEYVDLGSKMLNVIVKTHEEILADRTPLERVNEYTNNVLETVANPVVKTEHLKIKQKNVVNWKALVINSSILSVMFLGFLMFRIYQKNKEKNKNKLPGKSLGSIAETEKEIKANLKADVNDYFSYLQNILNKKDYETFFATVDELDSEIRSQYFVEGNEDFRTVLERMKGRKTAEDYRNLQQKIQMEKYAPLHLPEQMEELMKEIEEIYSSISK